MVLLLASSGSALALTLTVFDASSSVAALGAVTALSMGCSIYLAPAIGSVLDGFSRKAGILISNVMIAVSSGLMAISVFQGAPLPIMLLLVFFGAVATTALGLSLQASVRVLRREADLTRINGIVSVVENAPVFAGPIVGAIVYSFAQPAAVFALESLLALCAATIVAALPWPLAGPSSDRRSPNPVKGLREGVRFILTDGDLMRTQGAFAGINFANGISTPVVTGFVLVGAGGGASNLVESSRLTAVNIGGALGLLLGATLVFALASRLKRHSLIIAGIVVGALAGRVLLPVMTTLLWLVPAFIMRNLCVQLSNAPLTAIWQERTPVPIQGAVFGSRRILGQGLYPIAVLIGGFMADSVSEASLSALEATTLVIVFAGMLELVIGILLWRSGALRRLSSSAMPESGDATQAQVGKE